MSGSSNDDIARSAVPRTPAGGPGPSTPANSYPIPVTLELLLDRLDAYENVSNQVGTLQGDDDGSARDLETKLAAITSKMDELHNKVDTVNRTVLSIAGQVRIMNNSMNGRFGVMQNALQAASHSIASINAVLDINTEEGDPTVDHRLDTAAQMLTHIAFQCNHLVGRRRGVETAENGGDGGVIRHMYIRHMDIRSFGTGPFGIGTFGTGTIGTGNFGIVTFSSGAFGTVTFGIGTFERGKCTRLC